jgi:hypothetical protein
MDPTRFDHWTRSLFALRTRRGIVAGLGAALGAVLGATGPAGAHECGPKQRHCRGTCISKKQCCRNSDCPRGARCRGGRCRRQSQRCDAKSCSLGCCQDDQCRVNDDTACGSGGRACRPCPRGQTCCGGRCAAGSSCAACGSRGQRCCNGGACASNLRCQGGICVAPLGCMPCADGCCPKGQVCDAGRCVDQCISDCRNKVCGSDGCGNSCGTCDAGTDCTSGFCCPSARVCGNVCCPQGQRCSGGMCGVPPNCLPRYSFCGPNTLQCCSDNCMGEGYPDANCLYGAPPQSCYSDLDCKGIPGWPPRCVGFICRRN